MRRKWGIRWVRFVDPRLVGYKPRVRLSYCLGREGGVKHILRLFLSCPGLFIFSGMGLRKTMLLLPK